MKWTVFIKFENELIILGQSAKGSIEKQTSDLKSDAKDVVKNVGEYFSEKGLNLGFFFL